MPSSPSWFSKIARLWCPASVTLEPPAATVSRYSLRLIDEDGKAYTIAELVSQFGAVSSVAGKTGNVSLGVGDIDTLQTQLSAKALKDKPSFTGPATFAWQTGYGSSPVLVIDTASNGGPAAIRSLGGYYHDINATPQPFMTGNNATSSDAVLAMTKTRVRAAEAVGTAPSTPATHWNGFYIFPSRLSLNLDRNFWGYYSKGDGQVNGKDWFTLPEVFPGAPYATVMWNSSESRWVAEDWQGRSWYKQGGPNLDTSAWVLRSGTPVVEGGGIRLGFDYPGPGQMFFAADAPGVIYVQNPSNTLDRIPKLDPGGNLPVDGLLCRRVGYEQIVSDIPDFEELVYLADQDCFVIGDGSNYISQLPWIGVARFNLGGMPGMNAGEEFQVLNNCGATEAILTLPFDLSYYDEESNAFPPFTALPIPPGMKVTVIVDGPQLSAIKFKAGGDGGFHSLADAPLGSQFYPSIEETGVAHFIPRGQENGHAVLYSRNASYA